MNTQFVPGCLVKLKQCVYLSELPCVIPLGNIKIEKDMICTIIACFEQEKKSWYLLMYAGTIGWDFFDKQFFIGTYYEKIT